MGADFTADHFFTHYEAVGWKVGKNQMKNWKMAVQTWIHNDKRMRANKQVNNDKINFKKVKY